MLKTNLLCLSLLVAPFTLFAAEPLRIGVIPKMKENVYWKTVIAGAMKAAADLTAEGRAVDIVWDATDQEDQIDAQRAIVERFVGQNVDAIVLAPAHAQGMVPAIEQVATKIPVIVVDSPLASRLPKSTVATNNYKAGLLAGRRLAEAIGGKGNVALFRYMKGHGSTQPRESGFLDAMKKYPGIQVVSSDFHAGATIAEATVHAKQLLEKCGANLQGVFGSNLYATLGLLAALRETGQAGKVAFMGFDTDERVIEGLRKGELAGVAVQQPFMMGYLGVRTAVQAIQGKPVDSEIDTDVKIVTRENVETPEIQLLLSPVGR